MPGAIGKDARQFAAFTPLYGLAATARTVAGVQTIQRAPADAAAQMAQLSAQNAAAQGKLLDTIALQPQVTPGDNFAATKAAQLQSLRQGVAATLKTGPGGGPTAIYSPTLKSKMGQ
ncbi:MAG TPA: hypothetical protein VH309_02495 [Elusimicrobiota bacterium]|jgi:hypothetical protein|nr:hypothetical protein [Elusimicrobiota bacterium]